RPLTLKLALPSPICPRKLQSRPLSFNCLEAKNVSGCDLEISLGGDVRGRDVRYGSLPWIESLQIANEGSARVEAERGALRRVHFYDPAAIERKSAERGKFMAGGERSCLRVIDEARPRLDIDVPNAACVAVTNAEESLRGAAASFARARAGKLVHFGVEPEMVCHSVGNHRADSGIIHADRKSTR